ncbi:TfoX/Sxy family protein [Quadrisphaera granulorum]|uniref:TfoX/Sxy family protein n=1 Tax=Quadrisphaera granulorum TaxID=317664 RepID=UPI001B86E520|nr:TfoX/Sxy family protein [Quadrisphaera granulorum]
MPQPMTDERRAQRRLGQALLDEVVAELEVLPGASRRRMFGSEGLFAFGRVVAFVDGDGSLVVKVPAEQATELVAAGSAEHVRMGRSPAREWVSVPRIGEAEDVRSLWERLVRVSYDVVSSATPSSS